jgi:tetratricopeptide (TPR) repeat protein
MVAFEEEELGWMEMDAGQLEAAEEHFRRALALDPLRADSLIGLGVVYLAWGEFDEAEEVFQSALLRAETMLPRRRSRELGQDPRVRPYLRALYHLAVTAIRQDIWDEAETFLRQMLEWDDGGLDGQAFPLLAEAYHRRGALKEAARYYEQALAQDVWSWYSLGSVYLALGAMASAERVLRHALTVVPDVGRWIMYFPKVVPLPTATVLNEDFREAVSYVVDHMEFWPEASREALVEIAARIEVAP